MAYVTKTASQLRAVVREITDLDTADLSDSLLNMYMNDGYYRILDLEKRWPFLETTFTFTTVANQKAYNIAAMTADPIAQIVSVIDNTATGVRLDNISHDEGELAFNGTQDVSGEPLFYSFWKGEINLFPKPNNARVLNVRGYREPTDWITTGGAVDASANLHLPLVYYACSRVYQRLEDPDMANEYKRSFDEGVVLAVKNIMKPVSHAHTVLSAGRTTGRPTYNAWLKSMGHTLGNN